MSWLKRELTIVWSTHRKWGVSLAALAAYAVNNGLISGTALRWTNIAIGALAAIGVRAVPNAPSAG